MNENSMSKSGKQEYDRLEQEINNLNGNLPPVNIIITGITGVGKSTLVNAIFGNDIAATSLGRVGTKKLQEYSDEGDTIHIWDTVGLEIDESGSSTKQAMDDIRTLVNDKAENGDMFDKIHAIWYCSNAESKRFQPEEARFVHELYDLDVPLSIVMTQCISKKQNCEFEDEIRAILKERKSELSDIPIFQVLAEPKEVDFGDETKTLPQKGLDELLHSVEDSLSEYLKKGFIAAQQIDKEAKRSFAIKEVKEVANEAKNGILDKVYGINILVSRYRVEILFKHIITYYEPKFNNCMPKKFKNIVDATIENYRASEKDLLVPLKSLDRLKSDFKYYRKKLNSDFSDDFNFLTLNALLIFIWELKFICAIEDVWHALDEEKLKDLDTIVNAIHERLKRENEKRSNMQNQKSSR